MVVKGKQETFAPVTRRHIRSHGCREPHATWQRQSPDSYA